MDLKEKKMADRLTAVKARDWLYSYAKKNDIKITEFTSDDGLCFAHLEGERHKSCTAVANEKTLALLICFLNFIDKRINFLEISK